MNFKSILSVAGVLAAGVLLVPVVTRAQDMGSSSGMTCCKPRQVAQADIKKPAPVKPAKNGVQKVTVTIDGGYSPSILSVKAGKPVEITFVRKSAAGCDGTLVIPDLKFEKNLKQGEKTVVKFTPKKTGSIGFQCGMAMYKGQISVI